jgi:BNR repeat protein
MPAVILRRRVVAVVALCCLVILTLVFAFRGPSPDSDPPRADGRAVPSDETGLRRPDELAGDGPDEQGEGERHSLEDEIREAAERTKGREEAYEQARADGVLGRTGPRNPIPNPGWTAEHVWSPIYDDWEPTIAADPNAPFVYTATTRYGGPRACPTCPSVQIVLRVSSDGGKTWGNDRYLCRCKDIGTGQYDPVLEVGGNGTLHAAWLNGFRPGVSYSRSEDNGRSWSDPVSVPTAWSDKPVLAVSDEGQDVYIAFNGPSHGDSIVGISHDGGETFVATRVTKSDRYHFAGGAWASPDGRSVAFAQSSYNVDGYRGRIHSEVILSDDAGETWRRVRVATGRRQPACTSKGCFDGFYGPTPTLAGDDEGRLVFVYAANDVSRGLQRVHATASTDGGATWAEPVALSPDGPNAVFPAATAYGTGDFRVWWMDTRTGRWNVWYRRSTDGGLTWSKAVRLSNATGGAFYKGRRGFLEAYGDYGEIDVTDEGKTVAIWGEGVSYSGPGGSWFARER